MQKEQIQEFTRRISQSNRSGLTVITYEILFAHLSDAKCALEEKRWDAYKITIRLALKCVNELIETLNFSYDLAQELYRTYMYCKELLATALYKRSTAEIQECEALMQMLYKSFKAVAETDHTPPLMKNTEQVYAGYTYGRSDVNESNMADTTRGFFA